MIVLPAEDRFTHLDKTQECNGRTDRSAVAITADAL